MPLGGLVGNKPKPIKEAIELLEGIELERHATCAFLATKRDLHLGTQVRSQA